MLGLAGCRRDRPAPPGWSASRATIDLGEIGGLSGIAPAEHGRVWAVVERDPVLLTVDVTDEPRVIGSRPIIGLPGDKDAEALARIGPNRVAIGTEGMIAPRLADAIFLATVTATAVQVTERIELSYSPWSMKGGGNQGIEGLCFAGGRLLATVETTRHVGSQRTAPLGRYDFIRKRWTAFDVALTSETGKLASLHCSLQGGLLVVHAIERHYLVARLLRFTLPLDGPGRLLEPEIVVDVGMLYRNIPNYESVYLEGSKIVLLADNQSAGINGPAHTLVLTSTIATSTIATSTTAAP